MARPLRIIFWSSRMPMASGVRAKRQRKRKMGLLMMPLERISSKRKISLRSGRGAEGVAAAHGAGGEDAAHGEREASRELGRGAAPGGGQCRRAGAEPVAEGGAGGRAAPRREALRDLARGGAIGGAGREEAGDEGARG